MAVFGDSDAGVREPASSSSSTTCWRVSHQTAPTYDEMHGKVSAQYMSLLL